MSSHGDNYPNLRSRHSRQKPSMVPYVKSSIAPTDIVIDNHGNLDLSPTKVKVTSTADDIDISDCRTTESVSRGRNSVRVCVNGDVGHNHSLSGYIDDGGGGSKTRGSGATSARTDDTIDVLHIGYRSHGDTVTDSRDIETSFINSGADMEESDEDMKPLLNNFAGVPDSPLDGVSEVLLKESNETSLAICLQVTLPYIIAGFGMVLAGMVLDIVQHWPVFEQVSEIFVLVPALLGLKGNLEMTLASRLSTQANIGNMDKKSEKWKMIGGNMALIQAQAIVVGFLASFVAMVMGWIPEGEFNFPHALLLCASSMCTASLASFVLGCVMVGVVLLSNKLKINPDNVATPIAASLGDLTTLTLLAGVAHLLFKAIDTQPWLAPVMIVIFLLLVPGWIYICVHNHYTSDVVYSGWVPVLSAMVISSVGGLILDFTVANYNGIAVFQPVINGVGGNLVAVQASRISTSLHQVSRPGHLPSNALQGCPNCPSAFFGSNVNSRATRVLLALVIPGHLIFMYTISFMKAGHTSITLIFSIMYLTAAMLQVAILLYIGNWMVHYIWRKGNDPDNVAIPYLTALGDLLGTAFLAIAFHILYLIGDRDADLGD